MSSLPKFDNTPGSHPTFKVDLGSVKTIKTVPAVGITASSISIIKFVDSPVEKTVIAYCQGQPFQILLWSGSEYDVIGQWTNQDVIARIIQLYP